MLPVNDPVMTPSTKVAMRAAANTACSEPAAKLTPRRVVLPLMNETKNPPA